MLEDIDLRALAERHGQDRAYVSVYLNDDASAAMLAQREERIRAMLEDDEDDAIHFEESMKLLHEWLEDGRRERPLCAFSCWAESWVVGYQPGVKLPNLLWLGPAPYIRPLAELQEEYSRFVTVVADNTVTQIWTVTSAQPEIARRIRGDVKNHVKKGGWSQQRYERRRKNELMHYAQEVGEVLDRLVRDEDYDRIVFLGSKETIGEVQSALSAPTRECVVGEKGVDVREGDDALLETAFELFFEEERESEARHWERIRAQYLSHGLAAVGPDDVLAAAQNGRVESVAVTRDARLSATRCRECENVFAGSLPQCKACHSSDVFEVDLVDALTRCLELSSAEIDFVDALPGLEKLGHVAALLRY